MLVHLEARLVPRMLLQSIVLKLTFNGEFKEKNIRNW